MGGSSSPEVTEHVMLHVGQLQELALPVPHLLCDHLAQPHRTLIHLQPGGLGTCSGGRRERGGGGGIH